MAKIFVICDWTDMRKNFDGLMAIIRDVYELDRWLMEGLAIDQPKAIKAGRRTKEF